MQKLLIFTLAGLALASQWASKTEGSFDYVRKKVPRKYTTKGHQEYERINKWLSENVPERSPVDAYLIAAADHFRKRETQSLAWRQFVALHDMKRSGFECSLDETESLSDNAKFARVRRMAPSTNYTRPLQRVVDSVLGEHAEKCAYSYHLKFVERRTQQEGGLSVAETVAHMIGASAQYEGNFRPYTPSERKVRLQFELMDELKIARIIALAIYRSWTAETSGIYHRYKKDEVIDDGHMNKVVQLILKVRDTCDSYRSIFGEILKPALFDAGTHPPNGKRYGTSELTAGMFTYHVCGLLQSRISSWESLAEPVADALLRVKDSS